RSPVPHFQMTSSIVPKGPVTRWTTIPKTSTRTVSADWPLPPTTTKLKAPIAVTTTTPTSIQTTQRRTRHFGLVAGILDALWPDEVAAGQFRPGQAQRSKWIQITRE